MAHRHFGLRAKSLLALVLACLAALLPAGLIGKQMLDGVRQHFGQAYVRNLTLLKRQHILAPIARDMALATRFANSELTRQWLRSEQAAGPKAQFFREAEAYRGDLRSHSYFLASRHSRAFYFNDEKKPFSPQARYILDPDKASDSWFFSTLQQSEPFNINVNYDAHLEITQGWLNILIRDSNRDVLGVAGTGLDLSEFLRDFIDTGEPGVTPMLVTRSGAIQAHRNRTLIATNQAASHADFSQTLAAQLPEGQPRNDLARAMAEAEARPGEVATFSARLEGRQQLIALSYLPELKWHVVAAVDLKAVQILDSQWLHLALSALAVLVLLMLLAFGYAVERLLLRPLRELRQSASELARGNYDAPLPTGGQDELGELSSAFASMARQIRSHTEELETRIRARTHDLEAANQAMHRAHKQINDSIDYASMIQRAILPAQQLEKTLGPDHFVLWRPRDVVGGDFYLYRNDGARHLLGVADCAGHGVPGAMMTMLARAALDHAINESGMDSPAALLTQTDRIIRSMLQESPLPRGIATNMDLGLAVVDSTRRTLRYAGAKIGLYWSNGEEVGEIRAGRRALGDRRQGVWQDEEIPLQAGVTYYLATDGFLDQAGGELGYGFGNSRFAQLIREHARLPMGEQADRLDAELTRYQGAYAQRDDITILSFRFD